jgi:hypothetical protein
MSSLQLRLVFARHRYSAAVLIVVFAAAGLLLLSSGKAASYAVGVEAESGQRSGNTGNGPVAGASGAASVRFNSSSAPGSILFEDDFNGPAGSLPDQSKWVDWSYCSHRPEAAYGYIACGNNETLDGNGKLVIPATPAAGSALATGNKFRFVYGTMSIWAKMPREAGYWPAFWTLNGTFAEADVLPAGEIDVLEYYSKWNGVYHAVGHHWTGNSATDSHSPDNFCPNNWQSRNLDLVNQYHKYSAKVEPNKVTFYLDDEQCAEPFTPEMNPGKPWTLGPNVMRGNYLILNVAIGGAGGQQPTPAAPDKMLVDRVEVRSL